MQTETIGDNIRRLREGRLLSREILAEQVGISVSHLEKIENGLRNPGMKTYVKLMEILDVEETDYIKETVQQECMSRLQDVILNSSEKKAVFLTDVLVYIANKYN
ncbi:MAG: helix-turn-helix transcriptional regulator [Blautia sp.]|nr:helix-turn-helix transcriptional regulator [Blautia sp.]